MFLCIQFFPSTAGCILVRFMYRAVGIATGYGLGDRGVGVRVLIEARIFTSRRPEMLWGPSNPYSMGTGGSFSGGKAAGA
jgi:hypothetical protein